MLEGSVLGTIIYLLYTCDLLELEHDTISTIVDTTAIAVGNKLTRDSGKYTPYSHTYIRVQRQLSSTAGLQLLKAYEFLNPLTLLNKSLKV